LGKATDIDVPGCKGIRGLLAGGAGARIGIVAFLYFAEGFPFGFVWDAIPVFLRQGGLPLETIGLLSLVSLPWSLKFFWAPAVDRWASERTWIAATQFLLAALLAAGGIRGFSGALLLAWLLGLTFLSATQDIACDAYTIRLLEQRELGAANGVRVSAYRIALIASGGVLVAAAGWIGWEGAFLGAGGVMLCCALAASRLPQPVWERPRDKRLQVIAPLWDLLGRGSAPQVLLFVVLYKLGDMAMGPMVRPFWVDRGLGPSEIGFITGTGGILATILGALVGGAITSSWGIFKALWVLGIFQAASNLGYAFVASFPETGHLGVYGASLVESFCGGLGTAPFLAFLMGISSKRWAATQYALLSALFGLARSLSGAASGWLTASMGYGSYFALTFALAAPAFALLPWVRGWVSSERGKALEVSN
jgi:PAT family beta-lactamase induction signal transducer AmpG